MLDFLKAAPELIPVEDDLGVQAAQQALSNALTDLSRSEELERRYIGILNGTAQQVSHDEFQDAQDHIAVKKGTQTGWYLPAAEEARRGIVSLRQAYETAVAQAKERLAETGKVKLKTLCGELSPVLQEAMKLAEKIEALRQEVGDAGADLGEHPCPVLLPGCLVAGQLELMKAKGLL